LWSTIIVIKQEITLSFETSLILKTSCLVIFFALSCSAASDVNQERGDPIPHADDQAVITGVSASGDAGSYNFSVSIASPDEGCSQYADWWEIISPDSVLIYRRVLAHSHVDEQPFTRSGGPVNIDEAKQVLIRAHMNNLGYGSRIFSGSVSEGFSSDSLRADFASGLSSQNPLPSSCAF